MNKKDALARIASIEKEAAELRKIVDKADKKKKLAYDGRKMYVALATGRGGPYLLTGRESPGAVPFLWYSFAHGWLTEGAWTSGKEIGQEALDYVQNDDAFEVYEFDDGAVGVQFFYDAYMKAHCE